MKLKKLITLSVLALVVIVMTIAPLTSCSAPTTSTEGLKFQLNEDGESYTLVGWDVFATRGEELVIDTYNGKPITAIDFKFATDAESMTNIKKILITANIKEIGYETFAGLTNLETVTLFTTTLTNVGERAFQDCTSLHTVTFTCELTHIGISAFEGCTSLANDFAIPETVTHIGKNAFYDCAELGAIYLPSVKEIGEGAFAGCTKVTNISLPEHPIVIGAGAFVGTQVRQNWWEEAKDNTESISTLYIGNHLVEYYSAEGSKTYDSFTIKEGTLSVAGNVFANNIHMKTLIVPASLGAVTKDFPSPSETLIYEGTEAQFMEIQGIQDTYVTNKEDYGYITYNFAE